MVDEAQNDEAQNDPRESTQQPAAPADEKQVDADETPAKLALKAQNEAEASGPVKTYNPSYSSPDDEDAGEFIGVSPEYRNASNETEEPYAFEGVEGENVEALAERTDGSVVVPGPVEHTDTSSTTKKTTAARSR